MRRRVFIAGLTAGFALRGKLCFASPRELEPVLIEVPRADNLQFFNLWVAFGAGLFEQEGLAPRIVVARGPRSTGDFLLSGRADVVLLPPPMFLGMMAEDKPVVLFASLLANEPINLIVSGRTAEARHLSAQISLTARLEAISGIRIGLASEVGPRLRALMSASGLTAERDFELVSVAGPDQVEALASGKIDALFAHTPYLETAIVDHGAVLVVDTSAGAVPELADGQVHALATTREWVEKKPSLIEAVTRAISGAQHLIHSDLSATIDAILASGAAGGDRRLLETIATIYAPAIPETPEISVAGILRDVSLYPAHPRAPDFTNVDVSRYVAPQFAEAAIRAR